MGKRAASSLTRDKTPITHQVSTNMRNTEKACREKIGLDVVSSLGNQYDC